MSDLRPSRGVLRGNQAMDTSLAALLFVMLLGSVAVHGPTDPATLVGRVGQSVRNFMFAPAQQPPSALQTAGKPTVIVVFASWCAACVLDLPRIVRDRNAFGDRVNFIGIDYDEGAADASAFVAKNHVTFPTESFDGTGSTMPDTSEGRIVVHVPGARLTPEALDTFRDALPIRTYRALVQIARAQQTPGGETAALERRLGVYVEDIGALPEPEGPPLSLPHAFVIDASGIVRDEITGYDARVDHVREALLQLGAL